MNAPSLRQALGPLVIGIDHLTVAVRDLEKSIAWYEATLGFTLSERKLVSGDKTSMKAAILTSGPVRVVLVEGSEPESQVSRFIEQKGEGVSHVALAVSSLDDALRRVEAVTRPALPEVSEGGLRQAFLRRDPESGVRIELVERAGGEFSERSLREMFVALEERDLF
jgi:4-hydroxyphenylpyruvate dioxygenase-like putative hemolysin